MRKKCYAEIDIQHLKLVSPFLELNLNTSSGLWAQSLTNMLTGASIALGNGPEVAVELDAADGRIGISGWKWIQSENAEADKPDTEEGFKKGFHLPACRDADWQVIPSPALLTTDAEKHLWLRTHVFVPRQYDGKPLRLVLGGLGIGDFSHMRVFLNGQPIGERHAEQRWHEPGVFDIGPGSDAHQHLRVGQDNVIALQATEQDLRTRRMNELDPDANYHLGATVGFPCEFEQYVVAGTPVIAPQLAVHDVKILSEGESGKVRVDLSDSDRTLAVTVTYSWRQDEPVLLKSTEIRNTSSRQVRVMYVSLGRYRTQAWASEGEQGFPVYLNEELFMGLAHPSGWVTGQDGEVSLFHFPARTLLPNETMACMDAVIGSAASAKACTAFKDYILQHSRRVRRNHDRPYAIISAFGSWPIPEGYFLSSQASEQMFLDHLDKVTEGDRQSGCHFDYYSVDFWADFYGDLERSDPERYPNGLDPIKQRLLELDTRMGLWISSTTAAWSIGGNPAVKPCMTFDVAYRPPDAESHWHPLCRASEPYNEMFTAAFRHHIRENGVRLIKFDGLSAICYNPNHGHLPGLYSTEAIQNSVVSFLDSMDEGCPDVFLMLYWGHRSPWWLLHADTLFEPGLAIEAASPSGQPSFRLRDSVTQCLDQAHWFCRDVPSLCKDTLGLWLSDWPWNSMVGTERWQAGMVMEMGRGNLLAQPWTDHEWLTPGERSQMAQFIGLLKAQPDCFRNSRFILGNPWKNEPYGYCCTDGQRAFLAINNSTWDFTSVDLKLSSAWGLSDNGHWDIYRWYSSPARLLRSDEQPFDGKPTPLALRPFETVLLEIVPAGHQPSLSKRLEDEAWIESYSETTCRPSFKIGEQPAESHLRLPIESAPKRAGDFDPLVTVVDERNLNEALATRRTFSVEGKLPGRASRSTLCIAVELAKSNGKAFLRRDHGLYTAATLTVAGKEVPCTPIIKTHGHPSTWQAWRAEVEASEAEQAFAWVITVAAKPEVTLKTSVWLIPSAGEENEQG